MPVIRVEAIRSLAFGSIVAAYTAVGTGFDKPVSIVRIENNTDADLYFSYDGTVDHEYIPSKGFILIDITGNSVASGGGLFFSKGTTVYVKRSGTPTSGSVYVTTYYPKNS